ncbi:c-type cytochrome biogenesis protein CcmI [Dechloromonas sp. A34]|uniref:c-type cytochrome biogenesis protein CcmI n=1 Tax=Dechloromonas sp. A34 TaxID=447588 RepID=UPI00224940FF|nr:c-type cytochrome biogenesis protein CcmI [Dechloromonas sp. A34]
MSWFVVVGGVLLVAILIAILFPLLKRPAKDASSAAELRDLNLTVLREQMAELERDLREGRLDQAAYQLARHELERRTLDDAGGESTKWTFGGRNTKLAVALAIAFPIAVMSLYVMLGTPQTLTGKPVAKGGAEGEHALSPQQITAMVERLALRLQENPNDGQGWLMLARSYAVLGRYPESAAAYGRALGLLPPEAQHYADFADVVAMMQGKSLLGEPEKLVRRALEIDGKNIKALALSGTIAFDRQDYPQAIREWQKVIALVPADSPIGGGIQNSIRDAENRLAISGKKLEEPGSPVKVESAAPASVAGVVELDPKLAASVAKGDTLFVFARAVDGPKMPLAMLRKTVGDLPLKFTLDDSMSMTPQFKLSTAGKVVVGARISRSGDALARAGDIEGMSAPVSPGTAPVRIVIGTTVQ